MISHRGIECPAIFPVGNGKLKLGHVRLPLQTEGNHGTQPFRAGVWTIAFVGEIFNHDLVTYKHFNSDVEYLKDYFGRFSSFAALNSDSSVNERSNWDGFWAIVACNSGYYVALVDPWGKKQLYANSVGDLCSEMLPLVFETRTGPNLKFRSQMMKWGYSVNELPWSGMYRLKPGAMYLFTYDRECVARSSTQTDTPYSSGGCFLHELTTATDYRIIRSKLPVGCFVSGGLDSSIIAASISEDVLDVVKFFTVENSSDVEYAEILAEHLGVDIVKLKLDESSLEDSIRAFQYPVDLGSVRPQHALFKAAAKYQIRVVLTGDGADEVFGGYRRAKLYDSQSSDVFDELVNYHLPRLDHVGMKFTIETRCPFLARNVFSRGMFLKYRDRTSKEFLRRVGERLHLPDAIVHRDKEPLKVEQTRTDVFEKKLEYRKKLWDTWKNVFREVVDA